MKRLLFTGAGGAGSEAINRLWHDRYDMLFADADIAAIHPSITARVALPYADDDRFAGTLSGFLGTLGIDLLIPGVDEELLTLARMADERTMLPHYPFVSLCLDKAKLTEALDRCGFNPPKTQIEKPAVGRGSRGVKLIQERLVGDEYTVMMVADRGGTLGAIVPVHVLQKRGITIHGRTVAHPNVLKVCQAIHERWQPRGVYNIQGMVTNEGFRPFEINPRVSTTFCLGIAAGVDPVSIWFDGAPDRLVTFHEGKELRRYWYNHIT